MNINLEAINASNLPEPAQNLLIALLERIETLERRVAELEQERERRENYELEQLFRSK